jgi:pilus assembly protein CpaE
MSNQKYSVSIKVKDRQKAKKLESITLASGGFRLSGAKDRADLLIYELSDKSGEEFKLLESLKASNAAGEVIVTSERQDTDLLRQAMRIGAIEFLAQPLSKMEVKSALDAFIKRKKQSAVQVPANNGKIFHVMGAKGGVGTTTVAVNLAMILKSMKDAGSVALVDLNTVFGEIPLFLSVKPTYHWGQIAENMNRLDSTFLLNAMAKHASGVHILPSPSYLNGHPPATAEIMERLLGAMKKTFDVIILDGGQSLDSPALKAMEMSDQVILITLLSLPCLHNTNNVFKSLADSATVSKERIRLVINRYLKKSDITIKEAEESVKSEIFWNIPNDYKTTMSAINRGRSLNDISPKAGITKNLAALADTLIERDHNAPEKKRWRFFNR